MYVYICVCIYICIHSTGARDELAAAVLTRLLNILIYIYVCIYVRIHVCVCVCVCIHSTGARDELAAAELTRLLVAHALAAQQYQRCYLFAGII